MTSGIKEIREVMKQAQAARDGGQRTIVFVDEIHRFNKAQQDAFLPYVENGSIVLIGATTENPSFEINSALLSRCKVLVLRALETADLTELLRRALRDERGFGRKPLRMEEGTVEMIAEFAAGDARTALNTLEMAVYNAVEEDGWLKVSVELIEQCTSRRSFLYDKKGEEHYNLISALHKSMRNSDVQAAVYWLARMLEAGEDPLYIARRLVRFASEDVGMADSRALEICVAAYQAAHFLGMPECGVHLTHATYCWRRNPARCIARMSGRRTMREDDKEPVPLQIRNAVTKLMKELDYGKGYRYAHDEENAITDMVCLPECIQDHVYYEPSAYGSEEKVQRRMQQLEQLRRRK
ncbi:MAG: replication-associated recombination protein A [Merdibacter sp.]